MKLDSFGLQVWSGLVIDMLEPHQHSEIELNFVERGSLSYQFSGLELKVLEGQWLIFWGAWPHHLTRFAFGTTCIWLTLPLATFLRLNLPEALSQPILLNRPILETRGTDRQLFGQWLEDGTSLHPERQHILELELEARLRRLALGRKARQKSRPRIAGTAPIGKAESMAQFIGERHLEPIGVSEIAASVNLNTNYATALFKQTFAMTILEYLTQHRIAHAQRLLATTDRSVLEIAFESGFGSSSQFYTAFKRANASKPLAYRRSIRGAAETGINDFG